MKKKERICKKCKAIINLKEHSYYISKYGQRKSYFCSDNCMINNMQDQYKADYLTHKDLFDKLKQDYGIESITIQTGGTLNAIFLRNKLIDRISIVVAPVLIGGKDTASLIDGKSLSISDELKQIKGLKLIESKQLNNSYLHLQYDVINETEIK